MHQVGKLQYGGRRGAGEGVALVCVPPVSPARWQNQLMSLTPRATNGARDEDTGDKPVLIHTCNETVQAPPSSDRGGKKSKAQWITTLHAPSLPPCYRRNRTDCLRKRETWPESVLS